MNTLLVHCFDTSSRDLDADELIEFRDKDTSLLHVWIAALFTSRVKLRGTCAVTETAAKL